MKLEHKLTIIFLLFFVFIIFNNNISFCATTTNYGFTEDIRNEMGETNYNLIRKLLSIDANRYMDYFDGEYKNAFLVVYDKQTDYYEVLRFANLYYFPTDDYFITLSYCPNKDATHRFILYKTVDSSISWESCKGKIICKYNDGVFSDVKLDSEFVLNDDGNFSTRFEILYVTPNYSGDRNIYFSNTLGISSLDDLTVLYDCSNTDKLNLFTLNLHDLDYGGQKHTFNISTYTNDPFYDDVMECYNKYTRFAVFMTNYERILTYKRRDDDSSFQYGAYLISGYIDFLTTDDSYFYYSEYNGKICSSSGTTLFNKDPVHYLRRFYFNMVYSEDSNDPISVAFYNNGVLSEEINYEHYNNEYLIGSTQTIYYANESNGGKFKGLSNNIRRKGFFSPPGVNGKVITDKINDYYTYDFDFAGGITTLLFSTDSTYIEDAYNKKQEIENAHNETSANKDKSDGMSYMQGRGEFTSTFQKGDVTDDTSPEEDKKHIGEIAPATQPNHNLDDSNWGILDYLSYFFNRDKQNNADAINTSNNIKNTTDTVKNKFNFYNSISKLF